MPSKAPSPPGTGPGSGAPAGGSTAPCPASDTATVRIVDDGGNPSVGCGAVKSNVEVSNRITSQALPGGFTDPSDDRDNFKIEVQDTGVTGDSIPAANVTVEMLKPGPPPASFVPPRTLQVELRRVGTTNVFRSRYLRLVVDDQDQSANPNQTILADWDSTDPDLEILGQIMKVTYQGSTGTLTTEATVGGPNPTAIRVAVHILRTAPGAAGVVTLADATTRIKKWFKRVYAQVSMAPRLLQVREVDPLENLVSISNDTGANATGGSQISFRIRATRPGVPDKVQNIGPHAPAAGATPIATANALSALITAQPDFQVRVVQNPPTLEATITQGSADLIISDPAGGRVTIENLNANDASQTVTVGRVNTANFGGWGAGGRRNWVVGSVQQRTVLQAYDTGSDRIDLVVVGTITPGARGHAMMPGTIYAAGKQAISAITMSAFMQANTMNAGDGNPFTTPHEAGHTLLDAIHAAVNTELMTGGGTSGANTVNGSKRISETGINFDDPAQSIVQESRIRTQGASVLTPL